MSDENKGHGAPDDHGRPREIVIHIDHKQYKTTQESMTGAEIRALAKPPISGDYDLWLEVPGKGDDKKIDDNDKVELKNGMHFYSVIRQINPGAAGNGNA